MLQRATKKIIHEDLTSPEVKVSTGTIDFGSAVNNFWHYRVVMNPRLKLKGMWFPRSLAIKLKAFYLDFKAGKKPVMLLRTPPQHGKSLSVIDFIAWCVGRDATISTIRPTYFLNADLQEHYDRLARLGLPAPVIEPDYEVMNVAESDEENNP